MADPLRIEGLEPLIKKIKTVEQLKGLVRALRVAALYLKGKAASYPPSTAANSPQRERWYVRGYGPHWRTKGGDVHSRKTSQTLGRKWTVGAQNNGLTAVIGNNVTYGPYVQDPDQQASHMKAIGWKTTEEIVNENQTVVENFVRESVEDALQS